MIEQPPQSELASTANDDEFLKRHLPGSSPAMQRLRHDISVLNTHRGTSLVHLILIRGESGTGKGHVARTIAAHRRWLKIKDTDEYPGPEVGLNAYLNGYESILLPALPETLIESELFGHKRGAFTGADKPRDGLLKLDYTDILLDEIGDASPILQGKLLTVLEERTFLPLGFEKDDRITVTARLLAATNKPLETLIKNGSFREDLYWRLIEHQLHVPALREQPENIPAICKNIIAELTADITGLDTPENPTLNSKDLDWAARHEWPGNIRQLKHALRLWLLDQKNTPLSSIVSKTNPLRPTGDTSLETSVRDYLDECLTAGTSAADTLEDLQKTFNKRIQTSVRAWYKDQRNLTDEVLQQLFPGMKPTSIRGKISQWKTRGGAQ
jgi:DNA-binding NtrC family response regulator